MIINRDRYLNNLINAKHNGLIKIITGIRRCGKSYLLNNLFLNHLLSSGIEYNHIISIAFDSRHNVELRDCDKVLNYIESKISDNNMYYILLDEVQLIYDPKDKKNKTAFFEVLNTLINIPNCDIYVTGSNSQFLSHDIVTTFRGRGYQIKINPLTFNEYYHACLDNNELMNNINYNPDKQTLVDAIWNSYYIYGGLPLILTMNDVEAKTNYLNSLFEEIYEKDLVERYNLKNDIEFNEILDLASSMIGSFSSYKSLSDSFKSLKNKNITDKKIKEYYDYITSAFLIDKTLKYDVKGKKYINSQSKYYFTDLGLRNVRINFRQVEETHAMENIIYNELKYRGFNVDVGNILIKEKNKDKLDTYIYKNLEIDFICNKGSEKYYIQSALSMPDEEKIKQEKKSLKAVKDSFKKIIIVKNTTPVMKDDDGIIVINLFDFLLNENSLQEI